jgi:putative ABC transport system substrate-binding protein
MEGQNIEIEYRYAEGKQDQFPELAAELVHRNVDIIIVAGGDVLIWAAKNATPTIPIVMMGGGVDPVEAGLIKSLSRPGGNVTGLTNLSRKLGGKRLELLKEAVPKVSRVAVLYDPGSGSEREVKETLPFAARALSLTVRPWIVRKAADFDSVFTEMSKERPDGLYVPARGQLITKNEQKIANFALGNRLPSVYSYGAGVEAGGLLYYGADLTDLYQRVVIYVDRIIKGTKPADLPVEQPTKFELIINLRTAQQIGLAIPPNILARADRVIR